MENIQVVASRNPLPYVNCIVEPVDDFSAERYIEFAVLGKPTIRSLDMYIGEVTITLSRNGNYIESVYNISYFVDAGWKVIRYNRLGLPDDLNMVINEIVRLAHSFVDDDNEEDEEYRFNHDLADELIERVNYFRRHIKLTERYKRAKDIINFDTIG